MTSAIVSSTIDADFPISGQDNDSQGFRDNFNVIKDGLATAASEITVLQTDTAKLNNGNDFNGVLIGNALTNQLYGKTFSTTTVTNTTVDLENGDYQTFTITGNHTLTFANWPTFDDNRHAKLRIEIKSNGTSYNVTLATTSGGILQFLGGLTNPIATGTDVGVSRIFDVWSSNNGTNVYVSRIGAGLDNTVLNDIVDVVITSPTSNEILKYSGPNWINGTLAIDNLSDVDTATAAPADGQVLAWNASANKWKNTTNLIPLDLSDLTDTTNLIPLDLSDLTDTTNLIPLDLSDLTDTTNLLVDEQDWKGSANLPDSTAASLLVTANYFSTTAAETATLAAGTEGQEIIFAMYAVTGNMVITVTNPGWGGAGTITFDAIGDACTLQYINNKWFCIGNNGAVFA